MREPKARALAPVRDRADIRVLLGPLGGSQELARRSEAGPVVVVGPWLGAVVLWNGWDADFLPGILTTYS